MLWMIFWQVEIDCMVVVVEVVVSCCGDVSVGQVLFQVVFDEDQMLFIVCNCIGYCYCYLLWIVLQCFEVVGIFVVQVCQFFGGWWCGVEGFNGVDYGLFDWFDVSVCFDLCYDYLQFWCVVVQWYCIDLCGQFFFYQQFVQVVIGCVGQDVVGK